MNTSFFDYKIIRIPEIEEFSATLQGANEKATLILYVNDGWEESYEYLQKIITATGLDINKDAIYSSTQPNQALPTLAQLAATHTIQKVILFGINPKRLGIHATIKLYTTTDFYGFKILVSDPLSAIKPSKERREALWGELKLIDS